MWPRFSIMWTDVLGEHTFQSFMGHTVLLFKMLYYILKISWKTFNSLIIWVLVRALQSLLYNSIQIITSLQKYELISHRVLK